MNSTIKKTIEADDVVSLSSNIIDKDFLSLTLNQTITIHGIEYLNPNIVQYIIMQDKPICLSYILQSSPEFRGFQQENKSNFYITDRQFNFLHLAINCYSYKAIGILLELVHSRPEMINEVTMEGMTALHYAAKNDMPTTVTKLLAYGSNPFMKDKENYTPLHYAVLYSPRSAELICKYLHHNFPRSFFFLLHKPIGQFTDMIEFAEKQSKHKESIITLQYFEQITNDTPAPNEPEPGIIEFKSDPSLQNKNDQMKAKMPVTNSSQVIDGCTCNVKYCIHYKRLRKCHICGKIFCPLHLSEHSHDRSSFFA